MPDKIVLRFYLYSFLFLLVSLVFPLRSADTSAEPTLRIGYGGLTCIAVSPNDSQFATGSSNGNIYLWDIGTGRVGHVFPGDSEKVDAICFSADGEKIAAVLSCSFMGPVHCDSIVRIWNVSTGNLQLQTTAPVTSDFIYNDDFLFCNNDTDLVIYTYLIDGLNGTIKRSLQRPNSRFGMSFGKNRWAIWSDQFNPDSFFYILDVPSGDTLLSLPATVNEAYFSNDGNYACIDYEDSLVIWNLAKGIQTAVIQDSSTGILFAPDNSKLVNLYRRTAKIYNCQTGEHLIDLAGKNIIDNYLKPYLWGRYFYMWQPFSQDGSRVLLGQTLWNTVTGDSLHNFCSYRAEKMYALFTNHNARAISISNNTITLWNTNDGSLIKSFTGHTTRIGDMAFSSDGTKLLTGSDDRAARIWNVKTGELETEFLGHSYEMFGVDYVALSHDGSKAISVTSTDTALLWDITSGEILQKWDYFQFCRFLPGDSIVVTETDSVRLYDTRTGALLHAMSSIGAPREVTADGSKMMLYYFSYVYLLDLQTGDTTRITIPLASKSYSAISPDGSKIATDSAEFIYIFDTGTGELINTIDTGKRPVIGIQMLEFSPDGTMLLADVCDDTIKLFDTKSGNCLRFFTADGGSYISNIAFSPDGQKVAFACDANIHIGDISDLLTMRRDIPKLIHADQFQISILPGKILSIANPTMQPLNKNAFFICTLAGKKIPISLTKKDIDHSLYYCYLPEGLCNGIYYYRCHIRDKTGTGRLPIFK